MGSTNQFLVTLAIVAIVLPTFGSSTEFIVGDKSEWDVGVNYTNWASDKEFHVGDTLVFKYPVGAHNVFRVNRTLFTDCAIPNSKDPLTTGNDRVTLNTTGNKWYFCGIGEHCKAGQKLKIIVLPALAPAPAPSSANFGISKSSFYILFSAILSVAAVVIA